MAQTNTNEYQIFSVHSLQTHIDVIRLRDINGKLLPMRYGLVNDAHHEVSEKFPRVQTTKSTPLY